MPPHRYYSNEERVFTPGRRATKASEAVTEVRAEWRRMRLRGWRGRWRQKQQMPPNLRSPRLSRRGSRQSTSYLGRPTPYMLHVKHRNTVFLQKPKTAVFRRVSNLLRRNGTTRRKHDGSEVTATASDGMNGGAGREAAKGTRRRSGAEEWQAHPPPEGPSSRRAVKQLF